MSAWGRGGRSASFTQGADVLRTATTEGLSPVYFIAGENTWLKARLAARLRDLTVGEKGRDMDSETLWAGEAGEAAVADSASNMPFGGRRRFVLVRKAEEFRFKRRGEKRDVKKSPLVDYLKSPSETTVLVLMSEDRPVKDWEGDALVTAARESGVAVQCEAPGRPELVEWLGKQAEARGLRMAAGAAEALIERVGEDQFRLETELDKLEAWMGGAGRPAGLEDVAELTGESQPPSVFHFLDLLFVDRATGRALAMLSRLLQDMHPLQLHALLAMQLRKLVSVKGMHEAGASQWDIARGANLPYGLVQRLMMMVQRTPPERFAELMKALADAETSLKRGGDGKGTLERLVVEVCLEGRAG